MLMSYDDYEKMASGGGFLVREAAKNKIKS
jgi:hypothetical protein